MKITAFNGSPRKERGNTHVMVTAFLDGAKAAGAETENVFLAGKKIEPCIGCYACWTKTPGRCIHEDDMPGLLGGFLSSDVVVFASPVYVDNVTGLMKGFMDRLIVTGDPHMERDEQGECRHVKRHSKPTAIVALSNCGFPEQSQFQVLRLLYRRIARNFHCDLAAEIYRGGGGLLTSPLPQARPAAAAYCELLRTAGREVATNGRMSPGTIEELEKPLIPLQADVDEYVKAVNRLWDARLSASNPHYGSC